LFARVITDGGEHGRACKKAARALTGVPVPNGLSPSETLAKVLPPLLQKWRGERQTAGAQESELLADERRLLSGRNFLSFRKDMAAVFDQRLGLAELSPALRVTAFLAVLLVDGHQLAGRSASDVERTIEQAVHAARQG
jgi:hypothetical protein